MWLGGGGVCPILSKPLYLLCVSSIHHLMACWSHRLGGGVVYASFSPNHYICCVFIVYTTFRADQGLKTMLSEHML